MQSDRPTSLSANILVPFTGIALLLLLFEKASPTQKPLTRELGQQLRRQFDRYGL